MLDTRANSIKNNQLDYLRLGIPFHTTTGDNPQLGHVYIATYLSLSALLIISRALNDN